jgi:putative FmdB family regulatory protein
MPTYVYRRQDGTTFEQDQRMSEDALTVCPTTGQPVKRVITGGTGVIFKGSGFYQTDYARKPGDKPGAKKESEAGKSDASTTSTDSDAKPAAKKEPATKSSSDD